MCQPEAESASSGPQSGLCLLRDITFPRTFPGPLSPNAHREVMGPNCLQVPPPRPIQSLASSGRLINIIQIEIDFLYDIVSAAAGHFLSSKGDLG